MTLRVPILQRIEEIAIEAGLQLAKPPHYDHDHDCVRIDTISGYAIEIDGDAFQFPRDIWESLVRKDAERVLAKQAAT